MPCENLIGEENMGFMIMAQVMNGERLVACAGPIRGCRTLIEESITWARARKTGLLPAGKLISSQVIS